MSFEPVYYPATEAELSVALSLLDAYGVPYFVRNRDLGRILGGLSVPDFSARVILVPAESAEDAGALLKALEP